MSSARLPTHVEVTALLRAVQSAGGFATVLHKGDPDSGALLVVIMENGGNSRLYERMPSADGGRIWSLSMTEDIENKEDFREYLGRRRVQDGDTWIIELDVANGERFIGLR